MNCDGQLQIHDDLGLGYLDVSVLKNVFRMCVCVCVRVLLNLFHRISDPYFVLGTVFYAKVSLEVHLVQPLQELRAGVLPVEPAAMTASPSARKPRKPRPRSGKQTANSRGLVLGWLAGSAVSKPNFARKYAFESSRRDLHNALLCTTLQSQFFAKILPKVQVR